MAEYRVLNENLGRKTNGNPVSLPSGSAIVCDNFETIRPNVYRKTRGKEIYGTAAAAGTTVKQFLQYDDRLFVHYADNTITYDTDGAGTFGVVAGTYLDPFTGYLIKDLEFNSNLYFTTADGVQKLDALGGTVVDAGVSKALGTDLRIVNDVNWLTAGNAVSYRVVWSYTDANDNLITGAPSDRSEVTNNAVADRAVELNIQTIPEATVNYTYSVYRSSQVAAGVVPPEDFQLVYENTPTAAEIASGSIIFNDVLPDDFMGANLYTNTTVEGIQQSNYRPPRCAGLDKYRDYVFYANIENLQRLYTNLISVNGLTEAVSDLYIYDSTYTTVNITACADNGATLIRITAAGHGLATNDYVFISGVTGTTEANGSWRVTFVSATQFDLQGSAFVNPYAGAGAINKALWLTCRRYDTNVGGTGIGAGDGITVKANNGAGAIRITTGANHNLATNDYVRIQGCVGVPNANGCWLITYVNATNFDLQGSVFAGVTDATGYIDLVTNRGSAAGAAGITGIADNGAGLCRFATAQIHGLAVNDFVYIYELTGTPLANGIHRVTLVSDTTHFDTATAFVANGTGFCDVYERLAGDNGNSLQFFRNTTGTDAQNIDMTARSIIRCINRAESNDFLDGFYISGVTDPAGKMEFVARSLGLDYFYMFVDTAATAGCFTPVLPVGLATSYYSTNDRYPHAFMYSKVNQPEAVPLVNIEYNGNKNDPILAIIGLKDSLFIIKQKDGIYRLTGNTPASFITTVFDNTVQCLAANSIARGENKIFMYSNLGYISISDSGVELLPDNLFKDMTPSTNANITSTYGWFYESDHTYHCSTHEDAASTDNDITNCYNTINQAWYRRRNGVYTGDPNIRCGKVIANIEYTAGVTGVDVYRERKAFAAADFAGPTIAVNILGINALTNTVTLDIPVTVPLESTLTQGVFVKTIVEETTTTEFVLTNVNNLVLGAATIQPGIESVLEYQQTHCGYPEYGKEFRKLHVFFDSDETNVENILASTMTDASKTWANVLFLPLPGNYWGLSWGPVWGLARLLDRWLLEPLREHQNGSILWVKLTHRVVGEQCAICGYSVIFDVTTERTRW